MVVVVVVLVIGEGSQDIREKKEKHPGVLLNNSDKFKSFPLLFKS